MIDDTINIILKQILGENLYIKLVGKSAHYCETFKESTINKTLEDVSPMLNSCCIVILLIGLAKEPIDLERYVVVFDKNRKIEIKNKEFCMKFKEYIEKVERFKVEMLEQIT